VTRRRRSLPALTTQPSNVPWELGCNVAWTIIPWELHSNIPWGLGQYRRGGRDRRSKGGPGTKRERSKGEEQRKRRNPRTQGEKPKKKPKEAPKERWEIKANLATALLEWYWRMAPTRTVFMTRIPTSKNWTTRILFLPSWLWQKHTPITACTSTSPSTIWVSTPSRKSGSGNLVCFEGCYNLTPSNYHTHKTRHFQ